MHTMGRVLEKLDLETTPINTKGYETLLNLVENTASDSFDLYYGLFMYNKNAMEELERLDLAFEALKELFGHLHEVLRRQLFGKAEEAGQRHWKLYRKISLQNATIISEYDRPLGFEKIASSDAAASGGETIGRP
ncbi:Arogenate dehydrogenase 1, chloroplastic [Capsicum chinense]|nr:Arogenate dehydrogenase 1, chloroplastic [Capsicum chinense]